MCVNDIYNRPSYTFSVTYSSYLLHLNSIPMKMVAHHSHLKELGVDLRLREGDLPPQVNVLFGSRLKSNILFTDFGFQLIGQRSFPLVGEEEKDGFVFIFSLILIKHQQA